MIKAGIKTEEYRDDTPYYQSRLICQTDDQEKDSYDLIYGGNIIGGVNHLAIQKMRRYDFVEFRNGYAKNAPRIRWSVMITASPNGVPNLGKFISLSHGKTNAKKSSITPANRSNTALYNSNYNRIRNNEKKA